MSRAWGVIIFHNPSGWGVIISQIVAMKKSDNRGRKHPCLRASPIRSHHNSTAAAAAAAAADANAAAVVVVDVDRPRSQHGGHLENHNKKTDFVYRYGKKMQRIGCVIPHCNLQHGIMQPILRLIYDICTRWFTHA